MQEKLVKLYDQLAISLMESIPYARIERTDSTEISVEVEKELYTKALNEIISLGFTLKSGNKFTASIFGMHAEIRLVEKSQP